MASTRTTLTDSELATLADICGRDADELRAELHRRPWLLQELLRAPEAVEAVRDEGLTVVSSPFLLFAVLTRLAADELLDVSWVNEWTGPRSRLPVLDVEPLQEFVDDPARVLFVARLLASFVAPASAPLPLHATDPWELIDWLHAVVPDDRVTLLRRLGDLALFLAGVHPDATGDHPLTPRQAAQAGRSLDLSADDILALVDPDSLSPGLDALEALGARWYRAARDEARDLPVVVVDVAARIRAARRFLNHLTDRYLHPYGPTFGLTA